MLPPRMDKAIGGMLYFWKPRQSATGLKQPTASLARLVSCGFYVSKVWSMLNTIDALSRQDHLNTGTSQSALLQTGADVHTSNMTLKGAAFLAFIGTVLVTACMVWTFVFNVLNVLRGALPPVVLISSFIYAFACSTLAVFFYVFHRAQS